MLSFEEPQPLLISQVGIIRICENDDGGESNLRLVALKDVPEDANLRRQWDALAERVDQPQVFYTWEWAFAVQRAYRSSLHPLLFLAYDEQDSLCGVAALATDSKGKRGSFLCATTGDYCDFLSSAEHKSAFVNQVFGELWKQGNDNFTLTNLPVDSDTVTAIQQASKQNGYHCFMRTAYECAQVEFDRLERGKDGKPIAPGKKRVRRFAKAMAGDGPLQCDHNRSWSSIAPILPQLIRAHVVRFLEIGRISNLAEPRRQLFLTELSKLLSEPQWVVLSRMSVAERVYAWHYGFQFHDNWFWYQPTFDSSVEKHWPGFCLLTQVIQDAIENPALKKLDLGLGSEAYKAKFANASRRTMCVTVHRSLLKHWLEIVRYRAARAVAAWPWAERSLRSQAAKATARRLHRLGLRQTGSWIIQRAKSALASRDEVYFYELTCPNAKLLESDQIFLKEIDFDTLAAIVMQNADDEETLAYVLRCAERLRTRVECNGYALTNASGELLHFTWAQPFESFHWSELNSSLPSLAPGSMVLFDSWTPFSQRGRGYYAPTLARVVSRIRQEGKRSWGFSAVTNISSVRGLEKAGFQRAFTVCRYRFLWWQKVVQRSATNSTSA